MEATEKFDFLLCVMLRNIQLLTLTMMFTIPLTPSILSHYCKYYCHADLSLDGYEIVSDVTIISKGNHHIVALFVPRFIHSREYYLFEQYH